MVRILLASRHNLLECLAKSRVSIVQNLVKLSWLRVFDLLNNRGVVFGNDTGQLIKVNGEE